MSEKHGNEWHIISRHFAKSIGSYTDKQVDDFFDVINGKRLDTGCTQGFIGKSRAAGTGVFIDVGARRPYEGTRWWERWNTVSKFILSSYFHLTDRLFEQIQDNGITHHGERRLAAYEKQVEQMGQMRLNLDLSVFEKQMLEVPGISQFSEIFKAELVKHPAENDALHEYRVIETVVTVFRKHPLLQPGAKVNY